MVFALAAVEFDRLVSQKQRAIWMPHRRWEATSSDMRIGVCRLASSEVKKHVVNQPDVEGLRFD
jgi:hypothetical protein